MVSELVGTICTRGPERDYNSNAEMTQASIILGLVLSLFGGHTWWSSGLTLGSVVRDHSQRGLGALWGS